MSRDYIRELFALLGDGKFSEFTKQGNEALSDIEEDIADLQKQATFIRKAMTRLGEVQRPLPLSVEKSPAPGLDDSQRRAIKETAIELAMHSKNMEITLNDVLESLKKKGVTLTVKKPSAVVATIFSKWKELTGISKGKYRYSKAS